MIALTVDKVDGFVGKLQRKGINVKWDGWTMVFLKADALARTDINGRFQRGEWGFESRVSPSAQGTWLVNYRLAKGTNG